MADPDHGSELRELRSRIASLEAKLASLTGASRPELPRPPAHVPAATPPDRARPQPVLAPPAPARVYGPRAERPARDLESFLGGRVLLIAGVVIVLFGVAFFLRWAIVSGLLGPAGRVGLAAGAGLAALVTGDRLRARGFDGLGHALMGGGLGSLFLAVCLSAVHYGFIGRPAGMVACALITAVGAVLAIGRSAPLLAHLGFAGGYLAPALLIDSPGAIVAVAGWIVMLDLGVLAVSLRRRIIGIELSAAIASLAYYSNWLRNSYRPSQLVVADLTLFALVAGLLLLSVVPSALRGRRLGIPALFAAFSGNVLLAAAGPTLWGADHEQFFGLALIALAAADVTAARLLAWTVAGSLAEVGALLLLGVGAVIGAIYAVTTGLDRPVAFAGAALLAGLVARRRGWPGLPVAAFLLALLGTVHGFERAVFDARVQPWPFLNRAFFAALAPIGALFLMPLQVARPRGSVAVSRRGAGDSIVAHVAIAAALLLCTAQAFGFGGAGHPLGVAPLCIACGAAFVTAGIATRRRFARDGGLGLVVLGAMVAIARSAAASRSISDPFVNSSFASSIAPALALLAITVWARKPAGRAFATVALLAGLAAFLAVVSAEIYAWGRTGHPFAAQVGVSVAWTLCAALLLGAGFLRRAGALRWAGLATFGVTVVKVFLVDTKTIEAADRVGSFLVLGVLLVLASFLYQRRKR